MCRNSECQIKTVGTIPKKDIVCVTTDGAAVMKKVGRLISEVDQQLCFAHGIHLAVIKAFYINNQMILKMKRI